MNFTYYRISPTEFLLYYQGMFNVCTQTDYVTEIGSLRIEFVLNRSILRLMPDYMQPHTAINKRLPYE